MSPEENPQTQQISFLLSDFNVRLRDLEERNRTNIKENIVRLIFFIDTPQKIFF